MEQALRILIVDDEDIVRETLRDFVREFGHDVDGASDGVAALEAIKACNCNYDLAMVDVQMPGMDGLTFLARCREICPEIQVIMMTGHGDRETWDDAMRLGAADFLIKPIRLVDLNAMFEKTARTG